MKISTVVLSVIRLAAMVALAGTLDAQEPSTSSDAPQPPAIPQNPSSAIETRFAVGVQDMTVPDVDSHTYGVHASASIEGRLSNGMRLQMDGDIFLDFDQDHLDPHHTPVWAQMHFGFSGPLVQSKTPGNWHLSWTGDVDGLMNTVSSIERDLKLMPGIATGAKFGLLSIDAKLGAGSYLLEIDDDVPRTRGYERSDLKNHAWVFSPALEATLELTRHFKLFGRAQQWHDGSTWLETKYYAALDWDLSRFIPRADLTFSVQATQYNISVYHPANPAPNYLPILPWDDDRLVKLSVNIKW